MGWLEKYLSMQGDYDEVVHDCINSLKFAIMNKDKDYFESAIEDLFEHYYVNQDLYF